jgi:hypothetical protein
MTTKQELIDTYADWLGEWSWDWFGTLTFPGYPSATRAKRIFEKWILELDKDAGTDDFRYVQVMESGAYGDNLHFHILVAGLKEKARWFPGRMQRRWQELAGQCVIQRFDPEKGGVRYLLKTLLPERDFAIDVHFNDQPKNKPYEKAALDKEKRMKEHLKHKYAFVKRGYKNRIDPRARIKGAFELIDVGLKEGLTGGDTEIHTVQYAILFVLVPHILKLVQVKFWDDLQANGNASTSGPDCMDDLVEKVLSVGEDLRGVSIDQEDVVWGMDSLNEAIEEMTARFAGGKVDTFVGKGYQHERYRCAALLPLFADLMEKIWLPLKKEILRPKKGVAVGGEDDRGLHSDIDVYE